MSHKTSATVILDSITEYGDETRLASMYVIFPKMILGERNRHRAFSLSDRSSRAVPPEKLILEVINDPAMPAKFRKRIKGMGGGEELTGYALVEARLMWRHTATQAAHNAEWMAAAGLAKEIANRPLDPFIRMHSLMTATRDGWLNFFGLRLDSGADPTIQVLAQRCFEAYKASTPKLMRPGEWHLPFIDENTINEVGEFVDKLDYDASATPMRDHLLKVSAARCAHLSYNDLETGQRMTIERALAIYDKLATSSPLHASPMEHQATPDVYSNNKETGGIIYQWLNPHLSGNLGPGWIQYRKMLPGEAVAPLPEGYELGPQRSLY